MKKDYSNNQTILMPGQTIGILGGGQLGRMVILEGHKMGYRFVTLDPAADCPGGQVADEHIVAAYNDPVAAERLAKLTDLIVYEFENMDPHVVQEIEKIKLVPQGSHLLDITRHRLKEKQALQQAGVPVASYRKVVSKQDLFQAITELGLPAVLKTATGGYDGKGQWMLKSQRDVENLSDAIFTSKREYILEEFVPFITEMSVVVARSTHGELSTYLPVVNIHRHHILHMTIAPAPVAKVIEERAIQCAIQVAENLNVVGLIAVEMFLLADGQIMVNELAPRPHNSGHYTYDACFTSQFEQFIRAVAGLPLGSSTPFLQSVMVNVLGEHVDALIKEMHRLPQQVKVHWYGKKEAKTGRKMGHITIVAETVEQAIRIAEELPIWPSLTDVERKAIQADISSLTK